nr:MAG: hypothetical protein DIU57_18135 [Pseudomonadota bacterium]
MTIKLLPRGNPARKHSLDKAERPQHFGSQHSFELVHRIIGQRQQRRRAEHIGASAVSGLVRQVDVSSRRM